MFNSISQIRIRYLDNIFDDTKWRLKEGYKSLCIKGVISNQHSWMISSDISFENLILCYNVTDNEAYKWLMFVYDSISYLWWLYSSPKSWSIFLPHFVWRCPKFHTLATSHGDTLALGTAADGHRKTVANMWKGKLRRRWRAGESERDAVKQRSAHPMCIHRLTP